MRLFQHHNCEFSHLRIRCLGASKSKEMKPFTDICLHNDPTCCRIRLNLPCFLGLHMLIDERFVFCFRVDHGLSPQSLSIEIGFIIPFRLDESDVACFCFLNISLGFNTERCNPVSCDLGLNGSGGREIKRLIREFKRRTMMTLHQIFYKSLAAILSDLILAGIAVASCVFTRFQQFLSVARMRLDLCCALLNNNHANPPS